MITTQTPRISRVELLGECDTILQGYDAWMDECEEANHLDTGDALNMLDKLTSLAVKLRHELAIEEL